MLLITEYPVTDIEYLIYDVLEEVYMATYA